MEVSVKGNIHIVLFFLTLNERRSKVRKKTEGFLLVGLTKESFSISLRSLGIELHIYPPPLPQQSIGLDITSKHSIREYSPFNVS